LIYKQINKEIRDQGILQGVIEMDDPRWQLVERILRSESFCKSKRLSDFLTYVSQKTLNGHAHELTEQDIGENVFSKKQGYDPGLDNVVRVTARRVRQRLFDYFSTEGCGEAITVSIPVGGYVPFFEPAVQKTQENPPIAPPVEKAGAIHEAEQSSGDRRRFKLTAASALIAVLAGIALILSPFHSSMRDLFFPSPSHEFWSTLLNGGRRNLFVPGDSSLVLLENLMHRPVMLAEYIDRSYLDNIHPVPPFSEETEKEFAQRRYSSIVDVKFAARVNHLREADHSIEVIFARELQMSDLKENNIILSGAREANPWAQMFQFRQNFIINDRQQGDNYVVTNQKPVNGEPEAYGYHPTDPTHVAYGVVSYLPNLSGDGRALLLQGTTMAGTEAAMDFVLDPRRFDSFLRPHMRGRSVPFFEVLLKTSNIHGSSPRSEIIGQRFY
jgi:hypothetical protein